MISQVEPAFHVDVGMTPAVVVKLCWYLPPETNVNVPVVVMVFAFVRVPAILPVAEPPIVRLTVAPSVSFDPL